MNHRHQKLKSQGLIYLFALALALSIILSPYSPSHPQTSSLSPREALEAEIREDVTLQLETYGEPLSREDIEEYYLEKAQAAGLSNKELFDFYRQEFARQKTDKEPGPWQKIRDAFSLAGWVGILVAAYTGLMSDWTRTRLQKISDWVYRQGSGTPLFRNWALRTYRKTLVKNNEQLSMPFLKNREPLKMADVYVPLKVSKPREEQGDANKAIEQEPIDAYQAIADYQRLMIIGEPGSGKSVLLKHFAWAYGLEKLEVLTDQPVVVLLELYRLEQYGLTSDPKENETKLIQALADVFDRNKFYKAENFARHALDKGNLLLLLDGLDEINSKVRSDVVRVIRDLLKKYDKCRVVITCRTAVYEDEFLDVVERKLEVVKFTDQQMRRFLKAWEPEMQRARKSVNQMIAALRERPLILELARNPLLLTLIAYLYTEPAFVLPRSRADFYEKSTDILLEQREYKGDDDYKHNLYTANDKRRVLQHLAIYAQEYSSSLPGDITSKDRRSIKAEDVRMQVKRVLPDLDLPEEEAKGILEEIAERSGLFIKIGRGERYLFPHLTIQEYFAADALQDKEAELLHYFDTDPIVWREVIKLWCGLANESTNLVREISQRNLIIGFECLSEAQQVEQDLANRIIDQFKPDLDVPQADDTLTRAFGAIAANDRARGKAVFEYLEQTLFDPNASDLRKKMAADALSRTNLSKAATVLLHWYGSNEAIVRMGDMAVPDLAKLAQAGNLQALDDLYQIRTPDAAYVLVSLLWNEEIKIAGRAAWYLGALLPQFGIEDALRKYELTSEQQQSEILDWIWQPFNKPSTSALPIIAGRIAYILQQDLFEIIPNIRPTLDPRLAVPLCAIQLKPNQLPDAFPYPLQVEALLDQARQSPELIHTCWITVEQLLQNQPSTDAQWRLILSGLTPKLRLDLLNRLINRKHPSKSHWLNLHHVVDYELETGWHYRILLLIFLIIAVSAILQLWAMVFAQPESIQIVCTCGLLSTILIISCLSNALQESNFYDLGLLGLPNFLRQITQFSNQGFVWQGIRDMYWCLLKGGVVFSGSISLIAVSLFSIIDTDYMTVSNLPFVTVSNNAVIYGTITTTIIFAGSASITSLGAVFGTILGVSMIAGANGVADAINITETLSYRMLYFLSIVFGIATIVFVNQISAITTVAIVISAFAGVLIGVALGAWYGFGLSSGKKRLRLLAIFAFPWFSWFPLVVFLSILALYSLVTKLSPLSAYIWPQTILTAISIAGLYIFLWWRGKWLDARAKNPFQGGALGEAIGAKR